MEEKYFTEFQSTADDRSLHGNSTKNERFSRLPRYAQDLQVARLLARGDREKWDKLNHELETKYPAYIETKYPDLFTDIMKEEIIDILKERLEDKGQFKTLRRYKGDCALSSWITRQLDWSIKTWLRKHEKELQLSAGDSDTPDEEHLTQAQYIYPVEPESETLPQVLFVLKDEERWAFLLRYYDYFGFPVEAIQGLARKRGMTIKDLTVEIVHAFHGEKGTLPQKRMKKSKMLERLERLFFDVLLLQRKEQVFSTDPGFPASDASIVIKGQKKLTSVRTKLQRKELQRIEELDKLKGFVITSPYDVVSRLMGAENEVTVRGLVSSARKKLSAHLSASMKGKKDILQKFSVLEDKRNDKLSG